MKVYAIYDEELNADTAIGFLFYYEKAKEFIIELQDNLNEWEAPLLFQKLVKQGIYTVPKEMAYLWVKERVIPSGRQNIGSILKNAKLNEYNEMKLLELSKGKCSQDSCYIVEVAEEDIQDVIKERRCHNIKECFVAEDKQIICLFMDNSVRKVDLSELQEERKDIAYVMHNNELMNTIKIGVGGYSITFNDSIEIGVEYLRSKGELLPISAKDFYRFVETNIVDTTKACEMMQCSRQNLSYLINSKKISPIFSGTKQNLFTKGEIERTITE